MQRRGCLGSLAGGVLSVAALAFAGLMFTTTRVTAASSDCQLVVLAEWPVKNQRGLPVVDGAINGQPVLILLDTGGISFISRAAALRLGLTLQSETRRAVIGVGGQSRVAVTSVHELRVGNVVNRRLVLDVSGEREFGWAMTLGREFFANYDIEFDLPARLVRIHDTKSCTEAQLRNWAGPDTGELPMESRMDAGSDVVVPVEINGKPFRALLDSGAGTSMARSDAVKRLGITPESP